MENIPYLFLFGIRNMQNKLNNLSEILNKLGLVFDAIDVIKLGQEADQDQVTDSDIVIATLIGEASVDGTEGMTAIYSIIKNRAHHKGISMKNVCLEPKQFSMWNDKKSEQQIKEFIHNSKNAPGGKWVEAERIANADPGDTTYGSTHYYTGSTPYWATSKNPCWIYRTTIGSHHFGIDLSIKWVNAKKLPSDILKAYTAEGKEPARCYVDVPARYPPKSVRGTK